MRTQLKIKNTKNLIEKKVPGKGLEYHFSKEDTNDELSTWKDACNPCRKTQSKTRYHLTPLKIGIIGEKEGKEG